VRMRPTRLEARLRGGRVPARTGRALRLGKAYTWSMISWVQTTYGWAVNLDGTNAAAEFTLPRVELHSGPRGWTCVCHRQNGMSRQLPLGSATSAPAAKRAALLEALPAVGAQYEPELRALLGLAIA